MKSCRADNNYIDTFADTDNQNSSQEIGQTERGNDIAGEGSQSSTGEPNQQEPINDSGDEE